MKTKTMSVSELRNRLTDRIEALGQRFKTMENDLNPKLYHNVKTELSIAKRRLELLNERTSKGEGIG